MPALHIYQVSEDNKKERLLPEMTRIGGDSQRYWGTMWSLVLDRDKERRKERLKAHFIAMFECSNISSSMHVDFYRSWVSTVPEKNLVVLKEKRLLRLSGLEMCGGS